uniref:BRCT domain-containing protein n=1 Tax=Callorhinchus milii TaxID=7868 RepID=A0A4W3HND0_CALMI
MDPTLKYFLGIAGRRWVISYQCNEFEVRGDVINGRNHQGPRKTPSPVKLIVTSADQLEWMVDLCGASIAKEPYLFTYNPNRKHNQLPDACVAGMERRFSAAVVTREWVLDSVACYCCHPLEAYLLGSPR